MKRCPTCKEEKPLSEFNSQGKYCKKCHNAKNREWRERNKEKAKESRERYRKSEKGKASSKKWSKAYRERSGITAASKQKSMERRLEIQRFLIEYFKTHPCVDCGEDRPLRLAFDHRNRAEKKFGIGQSNRFGITLDDVKSEIKKCDVRCHNCHFEKTAIDNKNLRWKVLTGCV